MNRRSFLALLGVAPAVLPALPEPVKQAPLEGEIIPPGQYPVDLQKLADDVREYNQWIFDHTSPGSPLAEALEALNA